MSVLLQSIRNDAVWKNVFPIVLCCVLVNVITDDLFSCLNFTVQSVGPYSKILKLFSDHLHPLRLIGFVVDVNSAESFQHQLTLPLDQPLLLSAFPNTST